MSPFTSNRKLPNPCPRARASKLKIAKTPNIINGEHVSGNFEHFKIFRPYVSVRALCARTARGKGQHSKCLHDLDSSYHN